MSDRDISPIPDSPEPPGAGHYRADDDIELPPIAETDSDGTAETSWSRNLNDGRKSNGGSLWLGAAVLIGAIVVGGWYVMRSGSAEKEHPNWQHVAAAADASDSDTSQLVQLDAAGNSQVLPPLKSVQPILTGARRGKSGRRYGGMT